MQRKEKLGLERRVQEQEGEVGGFPVAEAEEGAATV